MPGFLRLSFPPAEGNSAVDFFQIFADAGGHGVLIDPDDFHLALDACGRVGGVGRIDHDVAAEIAANRAARRFRGIGRPEHGTDLRNRIRSLINENKALRLRVLEFLLLLGALFGTAAGHELDQL